MKKIELNVAGLSDGRTLNFEVSGLSYGLSHDLKCAGFKAGDRVVVISTKDFEAILQEVGQLHVQLAGCGVAALGGTSPSQVVKRGDYGWSCSHQDVLDLRCKLEATEADKAKLTRVLDGISEVLKREHGTGSVAAADPRFPKVQVGQVWRGERRGRGQGWEDDGVRLKITKVQGDFAYDERGIDWDLSWFTEAGDQGRNYSRFVFAGAVRE